jgi:hypothetical protein
MICRTERNETVQLATFFNLCGVGPQSHWFLCRYALAVLRLRFYPLGPKEKTESNKQTPHSRSSGRSTGSGAGKPHPVEVGLKLVLINVCYISGHPA